MNKRYLALCGGVGGAKLAYGLSRILTSSELDIIVNTGDDFIHHGLSISPDLDTVMYTLANINDVKKGWGIKNETWSFAKTLEKINENTWFQLGDKDLNTHIKRTFLLKQGYCLSDVTNSLCTELNIKHKIYPMSETPVSTIVETSKGKMSFQEYFVKNKCKPQIKDITFKDNFHAKIPSSLEKKLKKDQFLGVIICPSNPYLSIDPLLSINGIKDYLLYTKVPVICVSPIINNNSIKGPTVKIMNELGIQPNIESIKSHYKKIINILVVDETDKQYFTASKVDMKFTNILMKTDSDKKRLAEFCIDLIS